MVLIGISEITAKRKSARIRNARKSANWCLLAPRKSTYKLNSIPRSIRGLAEEEQRRG